MPGLVAFNRRWGIGSDDLVYPGILEIFLRLVWLIAVSIVYGGNHQTFHCASGPLLQAYYIGLLTLLSICIVFTAIVVHISMKGSMTNIHPRRKLTKLIYVRIALTIPEFAWNILGTYWAFGQTDQCLPEVVGTVKGVVLSGWCIAVIVIVGIIIIFDPLGGFYKQKHRNRENKLKRIASSSSRQAAVGAKAAAKKVWETRCKILCCCVMCDDQSKNAMSDVAELLSEFFQGVDLVATDIAAGLLLVQQSQEQMTAVAVDKNDGSRNKNTYKSFDDLQLPTPLNSPKDKTDNTSLKQLMSASDSAVPESWMTTQQMTHYMKYAMASYGWPLYMFTHLTTGICHLWSKCRCCACMLSDMGVDDDNCCYCHTAAIKKFTGIDQDEIIYASFHNELYEIPFFVAIDREEQAVVVAVRGTLSLQDALTDLTCECENVDGVGQEEYVAHRGILQAARYVQSMLEKHSILKRAFEQAQGAKLVITGHSLGAGAAALLSILLKAEYPDLMCFAFSPPGGLLSYDASLYCRDFVCSVVLGMDIVPRLALSTMEDLKARLLQAIRDCEMPKYKVLASGIWQAFCGVPDLQNTGAPSANLARPLLDDGENKSYANNKKNVEEAIQDALMVSEHCRITYTPLYPPGWILHIMEVDKNRSCFSKPDYYARWSKPEDFSEVLVNPKMFSDHLPDAVMDALSQLSDKNFNPKVFPSMARTSTSTV
ncbi:hypothetical protein ScPMuIL_004071 [Solemya velum]